ncbi:hypothetical protein ABH902_000012 [Enterococcus sp. UD-01]|jgi:hypothetical protein
MKYNPLTLEECVKVEAHLDKGLSQAKISLIISQLSLGNPNEMSNNTSISVTGNECEEYCLKA